MNPPFNGPGNDYLISNVLVYFTARINDGVGNVSEKIIQQVYHVPNFYTKVNLLKWLLANDKGMTKVLLFVKNKKIANDLEIELQEFDFLSYRNNDSQSSK